MISVGLAGSATAQICATTDKRWLVVLDDVHTPADLAGLWPPARPAGKTLTTTRRKDAALVDRAWRVHEVGVFTAAEASAYLTAKLAQHAENGDGTMELRALAADLGHLPLALAQAAAYIADDPLLTCADYRRLFADQRRRLADLVPDVDGLPDDYRVTVAATWTLSVELANRLTPVGLARPLLEFAAVLDPAGVPAEVFATSASRGHLSERVGHRVDDDDAQRALSCLHRLSLLTIDAAAPHRAVRIHSLVQRVTRETYADGRVEETVQAAANALAQIWPGRAAGSDLLLSLCSNVQVLQSHAGHLLWRPDGHIVLFRAGQSLGEQGLVNDAIVYHQGLRDAAQKYLGPDHADTFSARNNLALWQGEAGHLPEAVAEFSDLVEARARLQGRDHPDTLHTRGNLIQLKGKAGQSAEVLAEYEDLLADLTRVRGRFHNDVLAVRNNLAVVREDAGDLAGALAELRQVWAIRVHVLGPEHPDTLQSRHNAAVMRGRTGDDTGTAAELTALLDDMRGSFGPAHPSTLATSASLALTQLRLGDTRALAELEEVLETEKRTLGPTHPTTLTTQNNLAMARRESGDPASAVRELTLLLDNVLTTLGAENRMTFTVRANLAAARADTGDLTTAIDEFQAVLRDQSRALGVSHLDTLGTRTGYADALYEAGRHSEAHAESEDVLSSRVCCTDR